MAWGFPILGEAVARDGGRLESSHRRVMALLPRHSVLVLFSMGIGKPANGESGPANHTNWRSAIRAIRVIRWLPVPIAGYSDGA